MIYMLHLSFTYGLQIKVKIAKETTEREGSIRKQQEA